MSYLVTGVLAMLLGFLAGLLSFKIKSGWCAECGMVKSCPRCAGWADPLPGHEPAGRDDRLSRPGRVAMAIPPRS
ncbi:hypothetical protein ACNTMW_13120 [Planosporangium sp. 12N6]|uniref:hypothetical protein n=1 Tax=Planosporangium spinosum TaxID=3402278 RepID=UPI003CFA44D3